MFKSLGKLLKKYFSNNSNNSHNQDNKDMAKIFPFGVYESIEKNKSGKPKNYIRIVAFSDKAGFYIDSENNEINEIQLEQLYTFYGDFTNAAGGNKNGMVITDQDLLKTKKEKKQKENILFAGLDDYIGKQKETNTNTVEIFHQKDEIKTAVSVQIPEVSMESTKPVQIDEETIFLNSIIKKVTSTKVNVLSIDIPMSIDIDGLKKSIELLDIDKSKIIGVIVDLLFKNPTGLRNSIFSSVLNEINKTEEIIDEQQPKQSIDYFKTQLEPEISQEIIVDLKQKEIEEKTTNLINELDKQLEETRKQHTSKLL